LAYGWRPLGVKWGRSTVNLASYLSPFGTTSSNLAHAAGGRTEPSLASSLSRAVVASAQVARARGEVAGVFTELCLHIFLGSRNYTCLLGWGCLRCKGGTLENSYYSNVYANAGGLHAGINFYVTFLAQKSNQKTWRKLTRTIGLWVLGVLGYGGRTIKIYT